MCGVEWVRWELARVRIPRERGVAGGVVGPGLKCAKIPNSIPESATAPGLVPVSVRGVGTSRRSVAGIPGVSSIGGMGLLVPTETADTLLALPRERDQRACTT